MTEFSVSEAAGAGFKLIGQRPLSVLVWGLFVVLVIYVPVVALLGAALPQMLEFAHNLSSKPAVPPTMAIMEPIFARVGAVYSLVIAGSLVAGAVVNAAVYRAILEPNNRGFAYLRFGMREVWLMVLYVAELLFWSVLLSLAIVAVALISVGMAHAAGKGWAVLAGMVSGIAASVLMAIVALRLSLAAPMTFAAGEFRLFQSWRVTRGHAGHIFLVCVLLFVILVAIGIVVRVIEEIGFIPLRTFVADPQAGDKLRALLSRPPAELLRAAWPTFVAIGAGLSVYIGLVRAIAAAPWIAVYRMLKSEAAAS